MLGISNSYHQVTYFLSCAFLQPWKMSRNFAPQQQSTDYYEQSRITKIDRELQYCHRRQPCLF